VEFDIYIRISKEGDRTEDELAAQVDEYEQACRHWAARSGEEVGLVVTETNVSGSVAVKDRGLEELILRVERGESVGILTPYLDRFGRDNIEGCLAWRRLALAGGRLVCTNDGVDSAQPGAKLVFQLRMAIAEDYLDRVKANFVARQQRAVKVDGKHLGRTPTLGYRRDPETGRLTVDERERELVRELFRRRAAGANAAELLRWLRAEGIPIKSKSTVVRLLASRTFLGEVVVQTGVKGEPEVVKNHEPLVTEREWEAAQHRERYPHTRDGSLASQTTLAGLVRCGSCDQRLKTGGSGRNGKRVAHYVCTGGECSKRVSISAPALDAYVGTLLTASFLNRDPHIAAIMEGDTRYQDALQAVEAAKAEVDAYIDAVNVADVGRDSFKRGLDIRKAGLSEARRVLAATPPPQQAKSDRKRKSDALITLEQAESGVMREHNARFIAKVVVKPGVRGRRSNPAERAEVWLVGAAEPLVPATVLPELTVEIEPASAKEVRADLKRAAARGDKSAADYLAATAARASQRPSLHTLDE